jgi:hypothetical protein
MKAIDEIGTSTVFGISHSGSMLALTLSFLPFRNLGQPLFSLLIEGCGILLHGSQSCCLVVHTWLVSPTIPYW